MEVPLKAVTQSRPTNAPEWAMRIGLDIASRYIAKTDIRRFALAVEIAESIAIHSSTE